ncbi:hypothetical protein C7N43_00540 [Sphingobacteriales bacterium UPWRP_1]|nr:hypothetical protein BVG80_15470 [Sphingobacteriales bacterium TSM_CSM]PSJ79146.1 hypothetical protein C7N43_00540 [Sphingobacteriales bacterium UPWRP_1]
MSDRFLYISQKLEEQLNDTYNNKVIRDIKDKLYKIANYSNPRNHNNTKHIGATFYYYEYGSTEKIILESKDIEVHGAKVSFLFGLEIYEGRNYDHSWDSVIDKVKKGKYEGLNEREKENAVSKYVESQQTEAPPKPLLEEWLINFGQIDTSLIPNNNIFETARWINNIGLFRTIWKEDVDNSLNWYLIANALSALINEDDTDLNDLLKKRLIRKDDKDPAILNNIDYVFEIVDARPLDNNESVEKIIIEAKISETTENHPKKVYYILICRNRNTLKNDFLKFNYALIDIQNERKNLDFSIVEHNKNSDFKDICIVGYSFYFLWVDRTSLDARNYVFENFKLLENNSMSNLALSEDQMNLIHSNEITFPKFINGQAGSGKTVVLNYLFALFFKKWAEIPTDVKRKNKLKPPIYVTANGDLKDRALDTIKAILWQLKYIELFKDLLDTEEALIKSKEFTDKHVGEIGCCFFTYDGLLDEIIAREELSTEKFDGKSPYTFSVFNLRYQKTVARKNKAGISSELAWFIINSYLLEGKDTKKCLIDSASVAEITQDYESKFSSDIVHKQGYYYKLLKALFILENINAKDLAIYTGVFCDEAQDLTQTEMQFLISLSSYMKFKIPNYIEISIPIVFAGDPNQTINPSGFDIKKVELMFNKEIAKLYDGNGENYAERRINELPTNYRSTKHIVQFANLIHLLKEYLLSNFQFKYQKYGQKLDNTSEELHLIYGDSILTKGVGKEIVESEIPIIVPCDLDGIKDFHAKDIYSNIFEEDLLISPFAAKGSEYDSVVLYQFGNEYYDIFKYSMHNLKVTSDDSENIKRQFFLTKLYVAVTRAKKGIVIVDTDRGFDQFWSFFEDNQLIQKLIANHNKLDNNHGEYDSEELCGALSFSKNQETAIEFIKSRTEYAEASVYEDLKKGWGNKNAPKLENAKNRFDRLAYKQPAKRKIFETLSKIAKAKALEVNQKFREAADIYSDMELYHKNDRTIFRDNYGDILNLGPLNAIHFYWVDGNSWSDLIRCIGVVLSMENKITNKKPLQLRLLIAKLMNNDSQLSVTEFKYYKTEVESVFSKKDNEEYIITWKSDFYSKLYEKIKKDIHLLNEIDSSDLAQTFDQIGFKDANNENCNSLLAELNFKAEKYRQAKTYFDKSTDTLKGSNKYKECMLALAKENHDLSEQCRWHFELANYEEINKITANLSENTLKELIETRQKEIIFSILYSGDNITGFKLNKSYTIKEILSFLSEKGKIDTTSLAKFLEDIIKFVDNPEHQKQSLVGNPKVDLISLTELYKHVYKIYSDFYQPNTTDIVISNKFKQGLIKDKNKEFLFYNLIRFLSRTSVNLQTMLSSKEDTNAPNPPKKTHHFYSSLAKLYNDKYFDTGNLDNNYFPNLAELIVVFDKTRSMPKDALEFYEKLFEKSKNQNNGTLLEFAQKMWVYYWIQNSSIKSTAKGVIDIIKNTTQISVNKEMLEGKEDIEALDSKKDNDDIDKMSEEIEKNIAEWYKTFKDDNFSDKISKIYKAKFGKKILIEKKVMDDITELLKNKFIEYDDAKKNKSIDDELINLLKDAYTKELIEKYSANNFARQWRKDNIPNEQRITYNSIQKIVPAASSPNTLKSVEENHYTTKLIADKRHIEFISINNFKSFKNIELSNIGQFNLVLGANNTGKTSFLEALLFNKNIEEYLIGLIFAMYSREGNCRFLNLSLQEILNFYTYEKSNLNNIISVFYKKNAITTEFYLQALHSDMVAKLQVIEGENLPDIFEFSSQDFEQLREDFITRFSNTIIEEIELRKYYGDYFRKNPFMAYIPFASGYGHELASYYKSAFKARDLKNSLINSMKLFIPKIEQVESLTTIEIYEEGENLPVPLAQYGEGANKLFRILLQITAAKGKRLMIDEIDAGIHRFKFAEFWRTILFAAKENDVQLFATTHNVECLEFFTKILHREEMKEFRDLSRTITLYRTKANEISSRVRTFEEFDAAVKEERNIMGGE